MSVLAGQADVRVVPDLEARNMRARQIEYRAGTHLAAVVGARVPVVIASRADSALAPRGLLAAVATGPAGVE